MHILKLLELLTLLMLALNKTFPFLNGEICVCVFNSNTNRHMFTMLLLKKCAWWTIHSGSCTKITCCEVTAHPKPRGHWHEQGSAHWSPSHWPPHLIGPLLIGPPTHWSPNTLMELIGPPIHWSPISLVPHLIGPLFFSHPIIGQSQWSPISLVPQCNPDYTVLIGPPSHWSPNATLVMQCSLVRHLIGPPV